MKVRKHFVEVQVKDNPFVKVSPTYKMAYLLENSERLMKLRVVAKTKEVPYCDCFSVEEEFVVAMPDSCHQSSVLRVSN